jgi:hypothetical protein
MEERQSIQKLLALRKLTRAIADLLRSQIKEYLSTLAPLLRPTSVFGEYVESSTRVSVRGADKAFRELQQLYENIAGTRIFNLPKELNAPIEIFSSTPEITPVEYSYVARTDSQQKAVTITSPLNWILAYSTFPPGRLKELIANRERGIGELPRFLLHYLVLHLVASKQTGLANILNALHYPITSERLPGFGDLPITCISSSASTTRPSDELIVESTELSGMDVFEEVVNIENIAKIRDPLKDRLMDVIRNYGEELSSSQKESEQV